VTNYYMMLLKICNVQAVNDQIVQASADILRKFPEESVDVIDRLLEAVQPSSIVPAKVAHAWLLGEFGQYTDTSVSALDQYIDKFYEHDTSLQIQVISSAVKLFMKRSVDCKPLLAKLFVKTLSPGRNTIPLAVTERAEFYYKLLQSDADKSRQTIGVSHQTVEKFFHNRNEDAVKLLLEEFDTLSVFTEKPSYTFLKARQRTKQMHLLLQPNYSMTADEFQSAWNKAEHSETYSIHFEDTQAPESTKTTYENTTSTMVINALLDYLPFHNIYCLAQGVLENIAKLYFCAKEVNSDCVVMAEITITMNSRICAVTLRSTQPTQSTRYIKSLISETVAPQSI